MERFLPDPGKMGRKKGIDEEHRRGDEVPREGSLEHLHNALTWATRSTSRG